MSSPRFMVDARGQLAAETPEGGRALAVHRGTYALLPSAPDLLLFLRTPVEGGTAAAPRVVLAGDLGGFPLSDLIAFLSQSRWTGTIRVSAPAGERSVTLKEGEVRAATSDDAADRIGEVMVRLGYVDRARLEEVLREQPPSKVGRALVERGVLQAHELFRCVTHQVSEIFHAIMLAREGAFVLVDQPHEERTGHAVQLSTQSLLMDSIRKIDELAHFRKRIPHGRMLVRAVRSADERLEEDERLVLQLADGGRTVLELGTAARLGEFDATKAVFRLVSDGYAELSEGKGGAAPPAQAPPAPLTPPLGRPAAVSAAEPAQKQRAPQRTVDERQVARVFNFIFREIRDEVAKQDMDREFIAAANAALANQALSAAPVLVGLAFAADGSLPERRLLEAFEAGRNQLGADAVAAFKQALTDVMFFLLFQAGELLESRADEDLARRVKELLATLEV
ncbi:MAG: DUF4388 domain-containing protein [Myxococcaceae bacterium]|nr:DUF4388 domain-containing protein [Myxococcaceae bacterium]